MSSYFSSAALCPLRLGPSTSSFFSPGTITWSPASVSGPVLKTEEGSTIGTLASGEELFDLSASAAEERERVKESREKTPELQLRRMLVSVRQEPYRRKGEAGKIDEYKGKSQRVVLRNHQDSRVYQMTDLFKTHNTAFGT